MKDNLENIFKDQKEAIDFAEPNMGHFERFEAKLRQAQKSAEQKSHLTAVQPTQKTNDQASNTGGSNIKMHWQWLAVAASILLFFGYWMGNMNADKGLELADVSPKMEETQNFYLASIQKEVEEIRGQETPENKIIIDDAFKQLEILEKNYQKLTLELKESNEDKRVIYAMIANFQKRLEVLQNLVDQLDAFKSYEALSSQEKRA